MRSTFSQLIETNCESNKFNSSNLRKQSGRMRINPCLIHTENSGGRITNHKIDFKNERVRRITTQLGIDFKDCVLK